MSTLWGYNLNSNSKGYSYSHGSGDSNNNNNNNMGGGSLIRIQHRRGGGGSTVPPSLVVVVQGTITGTTTTTAMAAMSIKANIVMSLRIVINVCVKICVGTNAVKHLFLRMFLCQYSICIYRRGIASLFLTTLRDLFVSVPMLGCCWITKADGIASFFDVCFSSHRSTSIICP